MGEVGIYVPSAIENLFLPTFLLEIAGLDPSKNAVVLLVAQLYNAFFGPFVGHFSDKTRTRWGRRKPFYAGACIPCALSWFALWNNPGNYLMAYYLVVLILFDTFHSTMAVSYTSLTPEISKDYNQRTQLTVYRFGMAMSGTVIYTFFHSFLIEAFEDDNGDPDPEKGYLLSGGIMAVIIIITSAIFIVGVPNGKLPKKKKKKDEMAALEMFWSTVKSAVKIRSFIALSLVYLIGWSAVCFCQANLVLWVKYSLNLEKYLSFFLLSVQLFSVIGFPLWGFLSRKLEKKTCYFIGNAMFIPILVCMFFLPETTHVYTLCFVGAVAGTLISMLFVIPWSMVPDVIDETELVLGERRDGIFYSTFIVFTKLGSASSLFLSSFALGQAGYDSPVHGAPSEDPDDESEAQPDSVILMLRLLIAIIPACLLCGACFAMLFYNIDRKRHAEIMAVVDVERERKTTLLRQTKIALGEDPDLSSDDENDNGREKGEEERRIEEEEEEWDGVGVHQDIYGGSLRAVSARRDSFRASFNEEIYTGGPVYNA
uniref:Major facilitator superfamily (MFS) profile domain-containing protein n=1 Tax=Paramoeba aestuarina TaxID=180227 RepID=A0A7S4NYG8_9EUKA